jgi:hypothetical protein
MRLIACLAFAAVATGCTASVEPTDTSPPVIVSAAGSLTVDWTINGTKDPNQCAQGAAAAIEVEITDSAGFSAGTYQQSCSAFATSITLNAGSYSAAARLLDSAGAPRTTTVAINPFTIRGDDDFVTPIDFSARSFF